MKTKTCEQHRGGMCLKQNCQNKKNNTKSQLATMNVLASVEVLSSWDVKKPCEQWQVEG